MSLGEAVEGAAVVDLLVMRTLSTTQMAFVLLTLSRVSPGMSGRSLPDDIMSVGMVDECRTRGRVKLEISHLAPGWHVAKREPVQVLGGVQRASLLGFVHSSRLEPRGVGREVQACQWLLSAVTVSIAPRVS